MTKGLEFMPRRKFLAGLVGLIAAPMVVRAANLMPVKVWNHTETLGWLQSGRVVWFKTIYRDMVTLNYNDYGPLELKRANGLPLYGEDFATSISYAKLDHNLTVSSS